MQSESTTANNTPLTSSSLQETPDPLSQHGLLHQQNSLFRHDSNRVENESSDHSVTTVASDVGPLDRPSRLSNGTTSNTRPRPSFQRISEHENALSQSPQRVQSDGPTFKVIKQKGGASNAFPLDQFPNEVLTHILSHLTPACLSAVSLVSRKFYSLVTTPHAWRIAFSRFFPGQGIEEISVQDANNDLRSEQRYFSRLTALASWRSEYILRTRLLRSLERGKPARPASIRSQSSRSRPAATVGNPIVTYSSEIFATINHMHGVFGTDKKATKFIHGSDETGSACTSDPDNGKTDVWGRRDPQALPQFEELFVGDLPYGAGDGPAGLPNSMDVSHPYGLIHGEGFPGGQTYFRPSDEMRGRFLNQSNALVEARLGIPNIPQLVEAMSSVWIAKSTTVPHMTDNLIGLMVGSTLGVITAYSLGGDTGLGRRLNKGQITARWVLSPGVPIIAIKVDESYSPQRKIAGRIWAFALNALGEVFYLVGAPDSSLIEGKLDDDEAGKLAWSVGRSVYWELVEPTRRIAQDDPYHEAETHGSYSPRSSSSSMRLSEEQIIAETIEIEKFLKHRPKHFRKACHGWDMRRILEVDFAGDDGRDAGESVIVIRRGGSDDEQAEMKRFSRWTYEQASDEDYPMPKTPPPMSVSTPMTSLFGGGTPVNPARLLSSKTKQVTPQMIHSPASRAATTLVEEWRSSLFQLPNQAVTEVTASAIDMSKFAILTAKEDPLQMAGGTSYAATPLVTPLNKKGFLNQIPGNRARYIAIGTFTGMVIMFNMRGQQAMSAQVVNDVAPLRIIHTESPQISCLAVSALFVVHGGNDGLVQAWDPLSSKEQPIRTLHSRYSTRARRQLVQAEASLYGIGVNLYAAGAIAIDPDPTCLRGMVSLGAHLRYWSFSSLAADQYQSKKRRLRRSNDRGSNSGPDRFTSTGRGVLMDYIATEQEELKKEKIRQEKEDARLRGRFGVGLHGLSEEDAIRYAEMMSAEEFQQEDQRRQSDTNSPIDLGDGRAFQSAFSSSTVTPDDSISGDHAPSAKLHADEDFNRDIEEAIRLSLIEGLDELGSPPKASGSGHYEIPIRYKQKKPHGRRSASSSPSTSQASQRRLMSINDEIGGSTEADDLEYALRLSLAEEASRTKSDIVLLEHVEQTESFPILETQVKGKGKGRAI